VPYSDLGRALPLDLPSWPDGAQAAVSLTFDVDAESGWLGLEAGYERRLTTLSEGRFGIVRGLPRILELLRELAIPATFYVPGDTAERHTAEIERIVAAGHEIGHHGYLHLRSDQIDDARQRDEIERGLRALQDRLGVVPTGYRSASWELTPETFGLLLEFGFAYDSSCMADDRPYLEAHGQHTMLELPVHWSLDDWAYFAWSGDDGGVLSDPGTLERTWSDELASVVSDRRHTTLTMHPEVIGRGYRLAALRRVLEQARGRGELWFCDHRGLAQHLREHGALQT
jgi:peptidoglycan/xylan/chitin deacetylase (PgdA/CDA1 family)